jgi:beta-lactamase regulating signal transducer with metallopeptidase domain
MISSICLIALPNQAIEWLQLLCDMTVKGVLIMLVAALLVAARKRASAASRHLLWSVAVISLLVLPLSALLLPDWRVPVLPTLLPTAAAKIAPDETPTDELKSPEANSFPLSDSAENFSKSAASAKESLQVKPAARKNIDELPALPPYQTPLFEDVQNPQSLATAPLKEKTDWALWVLMVWAAGFFVVAFRLLAGSFKMWLIAKRAERLTGNYWQTLAKNLAAQLGLRGDIRLLKSAQVTMPMTWGAVRPVVLLPSEADDWSQECSSIVFLHELAHIKRRDCLTQTLAQLACAIYWFNPLVWSAAKRLRIERELACDDQVLAVGTRATDYATHLVAIASSFEADAFASPLTVGMACSQLESRVVAILNPDVKRRGLNRCKIIFTAVVAVFLVVPLSTLQPWANAAALSQEDIFKNASQPFAHETPETQKQAEPYGVPVEEGQHQKTLIAAINHAESTSLVANNDSEKLALQNEQNLHESPATDDAQQEKSAPDAQGEGRLSNLNDEQNRRLKIHGITQEFIESARRMGFENLSVNQLVQLRVHKIDEDFVKQVRDWGFNNLSLNQFVHLRISGVTTEYIAAMKRAGFDNLSINMLAGMKMQNVTAEFIEEMRRLGFDKLSAEQLMSLKIHNINAEFIKQTQSWGFGKLSLNELLQARIHSITPDFAREMKALGFDNLSFQKLAQLKILGINADFVKEMRGLGFENLTTEQVLQMKLSGINAEYVRKLRAAGFKNVSVKQMIDMKRHGIDEILLKNGR